LEDETMIEPTKCEICGESMPEGEEMFKFHGYSGPCPKPMLSIEQKRIQDNNKYGLIKLPCYWTADEEGNWETSCGKLHCIIEGTPKENSMAYCCYCGKGLTEIPYQEPIYDND
jgi:hypothetical protein